jgi:hypothetical protein
VSLSEVLELLVVDGMALLPEISVEAEVPLPLPADAADELLTPADSLEVTV